MKRNRMNSSGKGFGQVQKEIVRLLKRLAFEAGAGVRAQGKSVGLEVNPRPYADDLATCDLELLLEPYAPVLETAPEILEGTRQAVEEARTGSNDRLRLAAEAEQARLDGPRLSAKDLAGHVFMMVQYNLGQPQYILPTVTTDHDGRARLEAVPANATIGLREVLPMRGKGAAPAAMAFAAAEGKKTEVDWEGDETPTGRDSVRTWSTGRKPKAAGRALVTFEFRHRKFLLLAELRARRAGGPVTLAVRTASRELDGASVHYQFGRESGDLTLVRMGPSQWGAEQRLKQKLSMKALPVPAFEVRAKGRRPKPR